jgi:hypothetical protein
LFGGNAKTAASLPPIRSGLVFASLFSEPLFGQLLFRTVIFDPKVGLQSKPERARTPEKGKKKTKPAGRNLFF